VYVGVGSNLAAVKNLGHLYRFKKDLGKAEFLYRRALALDPSRSASCSLQQSQVSPSGRSVSVK
jgi:hypothetical protein